MRGNPDPVFVLPAHTIAFADTVGQHHIRARLRAPDGAFMNSIAFRAATTDLGRALIEGRGQAVHAAGQLSVDRWQGNERVQMRPDRCGAGGSYELAKTRGTINQKRAPGMSKLNLSIAIGDYDRNRPLIDGAVQIDGVDPVFMTLSPEEIFFRAFRNADFDICEMLAVELHGEDRGGQLSVCRYAGLPVALLSPHLALCADRPHQEAGRL